MQIKTDFATIRNARLYFEITGNSLLESYGFIDVIALNHDTAEEVRVNKEDVDLVWRQDANSENVNCAIFDVSKALIAFFKWREGQQLTANTVNEIETFAKEYESNL